MPREGLLFRTRSGKKWEWDRPRRGVLGNMGKALVVNG